MDNTNPDTPLLSKGMIAAAKVQAELAEYPEALKHTDANGVVHYRELAGYSVKHLVLSASNNSFTDEPVRSFRMPTQEEIDSVDNQ